MGGSATIHTPCAVAERCSDDLDPLGHGGALEADEDSGTSTQRERNDIEPLQEHRVQESVLGNGVVHHSHESWSFREVWRMKHVSTKNADQNLIAPAQNACI